MNIAVLSSLYPPIARGGAERVAELSANALAALGCRVHVVTLAAPGVETIARDEQDGVVVHRLPCPNRYHPFAADAHGALARLAWHLRDLRTAATIRPLAKILDDAAIDAVVSHNLKGLGLRCLEAVRARGLPQVHVLHDLQLSVASGVLWWRGERRADAQPLFRRWHERQTRRVVGAPTAVVSPSRYLLDEHLARGFFGQARATVLRYPVAPSVVPATVCAGAVRFAFAGQLVRHKGVRVLLQAWASHGLPGAELHVAGDGALAAEVAAAARADRSLVFHGRLGASELQSLFAATDAVVVPSIWYENSPMVVIEALARGCAVIGSRIGGIPELIDDANGCLVVPGDAAALRAALVCVASDVERWRSRRHRIAQAWHGPTPDEYARQLLAAVGLAPA